MRTVFAAVCLAVALVASTAFAFEFNGVSTLYEWANQTNCANTLDFVRG